MSARSAQIQTRERHPMPSVAEGGSRVAQLMQRQRSVEEVATLEAEHSLEIQRRERILAHDAAAEGGRKLLDHVVDAAHELRLEVGIGPVATLRIHRVGRVLHEQLHHVFAGRRQRGIHRRGHGHLHHRAAGRHAHARLAVRVLDLLHGVLKVHGAAVLRTRESVRRVGQTLKVRQAIHRQVDLEGATLVIRRAHLPSKVCWQWGGSRSTRSTGPTEPTGTAGTVCSSTTVGETREQLHEGVIGRGAAEHTVGVELSAVGQLDTADTTRSVGTRGSGRSERRGGSRRSGARRRRSRFVEDAAHSGVESDLGAGRSCTGGHRLGDGAHAALHVAPDSGAARSLAHHVVQQHVGAAVLRGTDHGADDRVGGQRGLQHLALEPTIQQLRGRTGEQLVEGHQLAAVAGAHTQQLCALREGAQSLSPAAGQRIGRRTVQQRLDHLAHLAQEALVLGEGVGVRLGELRDRAVVGLLALAQHQVASAQRGVQRRRCEAGRIARQVLEAVAFQLQVADDLWPQQTGQVAGTRELEARNDLLGDRCTTNQMTSFQY
mmetsp:Transcript_7999/g.24761  ORF Transcript_7999/g.24761 Transcript_7999/m.24761 type:complete len:547 (-) Transcript_7999:1378-3018(-)